MMKVSISLSSRRSSDVEQGITQTNDGEEKVLVYCEVTPFVWLREVGYAR